MKSQSQIAYFIGAIVTLIAVPAFAIDESSKDAPMLVDTSVQPLSSADKVKNSDLRREEWDVFFDQDPWTLKRLETPPGTGSGWFGSEWGSELASRLSYDAAKDLITLREDGFRKPRIFLREGDFYRALAQSRDEHGDVIEAGPERWMLRRVSGDVSVFDTAGFVRHVGRLGGRAFDVQWDLQTQRPLALTDDLGRTVTMTWDSLGRVSDLTARSATEERLLSYFYDADSRILEVKRQDTQFESPVETKPEQESALTDAATNPSDTGEVSAQSVPPSKPSAGTLEATKSNGKKEDIKVRPSFAHQSPSDALAASASMHGVVAAPQLSDQLVATAAAPTHKEGQISRTQNTPPTAEGAENDLDATPIKVRDTLPESPLHWDSKESGVLPRVDHTGAVSDLKKAFRESFSSSFFWMAVALMILGLVRWFGVRKTA